MCCMNVSRADYMPSLNCCQRFSTWGAIFCHSALLASHWTLALPAVVGKIARFSAETSWSSLLLDPDRVTLLHRDDLVLRYRRLMEELHHGSLLLRYVPFGTPHQDNTK